MRGPKSHTKRHLGFRIKNRGFWSQRNDKLPFGRITNQPCGRRMGLDVPRPRRRRKRAEEGPALENVKTVIWGVDWV